MIVCPSFCSTVQFAAIAAAGCLHGHFNIIISYGESETLKKSLVLVTLILFNVWKYMGHYMVIYLAGLQRISAELYEANA